MWINFHVAPSCVHEIVFILLVSFVLLYGKHNKQQKKQQHTKRNEIYERYKNHQNGDWKWKHLRKEEGVCIVCVLSNMVLRYSKLYNFEH